ncbi:hypothetical protein JTE90_008038 [Oedothorax gibbosus]|uniref:Cuticle protein n=1 Tax=Oedothorax gibbosus TaxID=931172 RepID=A0AAV6UXG2_9ARAC|nr:hypothetical protein JTE90_008038 [Oedothorax gibbosus]
MRFLICTLCLALAISKVWSQETTIPVGESGQDTLTTIRNFDGSGNYDVGYNENQLTGGASFYREKGYANGTREGSYGYTTRNGLIRIVTYVADQNGYRAEVLTNEPGVDGSPNPASVNITKETEPDRAALAQGPTGSISQGSNNPQQSSDAPKQYTGVPQQSYGVSPQSYRNPQPMPVVSQQTLDYPQQMPGPQQSYDVSQQNYGVPQQTLGYPQQQTAQNIQSSSVLYSSDSNVIRNYVASPLLKSTAEVRVLSPHGQYQYDV